MILIVKLAVLASMDYIKMISDDTKKEIAIKILREVLNITPDVLTRFTNGLCHSVYYIMSKDKKYVLRVTSKDNEEYYRGSIKWLSELIAHEIPVPKIISHGQYNDMFYNFISFIEGNDLGDVYHTLTDSQKSHIAKDIVMIQAKVSKLPSAELFGYNTFSTWGEYLESLINRSFWRIKRNKVFDASVCDNVTSVMRGLEGYFLSVKPIPFLDDTTTKNVLIHDGMLSGIVDVDEMCYGDSLLVVGLTNMALLSMGVDTNYIDYWLDEIKASDIQRKAVRFYTLLYCVDFMGEQGMRFGNDKIVTVKQEKIDLLVAAYNMLNKSFAAS